MIYYNYVSYDAPTSTLLFKSQNHSITIVLLEENNRLKLSFFYTDHRINRVYLTLNSDSEEFPYGCGEQFAAFNLKNKKVKIWVSEHVSLSSLLKKVVAAYLHTKVKVMDFEKYASYMVQPTYITNKRRFVHLDNGYMLGQDIIVYPVVEKGKKHMNVLIPSDGWIHLFSGMEPKDIQATSVSELAGTKSDQKLSEKLSQRLFQKLSQRLFQKLSQKNYQSKTISKDFMSLNVECPLGSPIVFYRKESNFSDLFEVVKQM
jgi:alpha-glucosidase (family GH31 glycosyl hydrolase)